ncbi:MAG: hypothetical protein U1D55_11940 [Phycisphaerae bacterium]
MRKRDRGSICALGLFAAMSAIAAAADHPSLLISREDLPRILRAANGEQSANLAALRDYLSQGESALELPGELSGAAFLVMLEPSSPRNAGLVAALRRTLGGPLPLLADPLEAAIALDWARSALDDATCDAFLREARPLLTPLTAADSPLDSGEFRKRLAGLALAAALESPERSAPQWRVQRKRIIDGARVYFEKTFPVYLKWRGLSPTLPGFAADEELDSAMALELGSRVLGRDLWAEQSDISRWMEHYLFEPLDHPSLAHCFARDDGDSGRPLPLDVEAGVPSVAAHLIARRTRDPAAATIADRVDAALRQSRGGRAALARWQTLLFDFADVPRVDLSRLPPARNFGGAVGLNFGVPFAPTAIWIEAGQPFLRRGQHFDAGHFLIHSHGGHLAIEESDGIELEAVPSKGGMQRLGDDPDPFDFAQYRVSTIAHNCMIFSDAARAANWFGRPFAPMGGQRLVENTCQDFGVPQEVSGRQTARQIAYGFEHGAGYLALDLTPAYDGKTLSRYTREFIAVEGRMLIVVDRFDLARERTTPTWILNIPSRPTVDGQDLANVARTAGSDNSGGVWPVGAGPIRWCEGEGAAWFRVVSPSDASVRVIGGPANAKRVTQGPATGMQYVGGTADSFERLVVPASHHRPRNAWYRLGEPSSALHSPAYTHWGRIEVEPHETRGAQIIVAVIGLGPRASVASPEFNSVQTSDGLSVAVVLDTREFRVTVPVGGGIGGGLEFVGASNTTWTFPSRVEKDQPLASLAE